MGFRSVTDGPNLPTLPFILRKIRQFVAVRDLITLGNTPLQFGIADFADLWDQRKITNVVDLKSWNLHFNLLQGSNFGIFRRLKMLIHKLIVNEKSDFTSK